MEGRQGGLDTSPPEQEKYREWMGEGPRGLGGRERSLQGLSPNLGSWGRGMTTCLRRFGV